MMTFLDFKQEFKPMFDLSLPLILAELGWMAMGIVDTIMVSRLPNSAEAIGATGLGGILFYAIAISAGGLLLGLDTLVSQSFGAKRLDDCHRWLVHALYLVFLITPLVMAGIWLTGPLLQKSNLDPGLFQQTIIFMRVVMWSTLPLLLYFAFRRYLQAMNAVVPVMFALISANLVNVLGNWMLIYGHLGAPALGIAGSGWSTVIARAYMAAALLAYILYIDHKQHISVFAVEFRMDVARMWAIIHLGAPVAGQIALEIGVFTCATYLAGRLGPIPLAAHQIALSVASVTFMVPLGISSAAAVRVGQALGRGDCPAASRAGWTALAFGAIFMSCGALAFFLFPRAISLIFTREEAVIQSSVALLAVAGIFQLFDGLQIVAAGALRGAGDTRRPMFSNLVGYWVLGLPLGVYLGFVRGMGVVGIWTGLCLALVLIGTVLLFLWRHTMRLPDLLARARHGGTPLH